MRIIAGTARGRRLQAPPGHDTRPTLDRVREALFSSWAARVPGCRFLDLFAGSGANGLEARSRGAEKVVLVDLDARALEVIRRNVAGTGLTGDIRVVQARLPGELSRAGGPFDLIFADPPYAFDAYEALLSGVVCTRLLAEDGVLCLEHGRSATLPDAVPGLSRQRVRPYGGTSLSLYAWETAGP